MGVTPWASRGRDRFDPLVIKGEGWAWGHLGHQGGGFCNGLAALGIPREIRFALSRPLRFAKGAISCRRLRILVQTTSASHRHPQGQVCYCLVDGARG